MNILKIMIFVATIYSPLLANTNTSPKTKWMHLNFNGIKQNNVTFDPLNISVDQSASPLFLTVGKKLESIQIQGIVKITKPITSDPSWKDQYFNLGIIYEGDYNPGFFSRMMMPDWLLTLYKKADKKTKGIGDIDFWGVFKGSKIKSTSSSSFNIKISKQYGASLDPQNNFDLKVKPKNNKILALWFHADGDDSQAKFDTKINTIQLK